MSHHIGQTPTSMSIDPRIVSFFERFYTLSDTPTAHEEYAQCFLPEADLIMGLKDANGYDNILAFRKGMWSAVSSRKHTLEKIFPFGNDSKEVMLYGSVDYGLKNGKEVAMQWAARAMLQEFQGGLRFAHYQVYMDAAPLANAMKEDTTPLAAKT